MNERAIILVGGGGHCKSAIDLILSTGKYRIEGIIDVKEKVGQKVLGIPIIGADEDIVSIRKSCDCFAVTIGQINSPAKRIKFFEQLISLDAFMPIIASSSSHISPFAEIGNGSMIFHMAVVNAGAVIGHNCIINNHALVEHDVVIQDHCHVSTAAVVNGNVKIGEGSFIGSNACIRQGVRVGAGAVIAAGSMVLKDVGAGEMVGGVPSRIIKNNV